MLLNRTVKVVLYALAAIAQYFIELFPATVKSLKHFLCNLIEGIVQPN
jgi:hypothetical protein